jgi:hypothetical protein
MRRHSGGRWVTPQAPWRSSSECPTLDTSTRGLAVAVARGAACRPCRCALAHEPRPAHPAPSPAHPTRPATAPPRSSPEHLKNKRPSGLSPKPADLRVVRPFDPALFNFTKAKPEEVVARVALDPADPDALPTLVWSAADGDDATTTAQGAQVAVPAQSTTTAAAPPSHDPSHVHPIFANISPIMGGHGLLVPQVAAGHPQVLTPAHLTLALRVMALAGRPDFHLGFNSLAAWASVNHLHFHATYIGDVFPRTRRFAVERAAADTLAAVALPGLPRPAGAAAIDGGSSAGGDDEDGDGAVSLSVAALTGWPLGGLRFALRRTADVAAAASNGDAAPTDDDDAAGRRPYLHHPRHVAALGAAAGAVVSHLTRHEIAHNLLLADRGGSVYVLPRAHQAGGGADEGRMAVAFAEVCGIGIVYSQAVFDGFTEAEYAATLADATITGPPADGITAAALAGLEAAVAMFEGGDGSSNGASA